MECLISLVRLRNTGLVNAGHYRITLQVELAGIDPHNIALVSWDRNSPVSYSVRGRPVSKQQQQSKADLAVDAAYAASSTVYIEYDEEDANLNESCLFHFNVTALDLLDVCHNSTTCLLFTLEYLDDAEGGTFTPIAQPTKLHLHGDRFGLMNECAMLYFTSPLFGSASLELSLFFASLLRHVKPSTQLFTKVQLDLDEGDHFTLATRRAMKRRLALFASPYEMSRAKLRHFASFCASSSSSLLMSTSQILAAEDADEEEGEAAAAPVEEEEEEDTVCVRRRCEEMESKDDRSESFLLWHRIQTIFTNEREALFDVSREAWMHRARDVAGEWSLREKIHSPKVLLLPQDAEQRTRHYRAVADKLRQAPRFSDYSQDEAHTFAGEGMFVDAKGRPVVFEQRFENALYGSGPSSPLSSPPSSPPRRDSIGGGGSGVSPAAVNHRNAANVVARSSLGSTVSSVLGTGQQGLHVIVLLHGFMGTRWDLKVFQLVLASLEIPGVRCRAMGCNEHATEQPLQVQGLALADEILQFCEDKPVTRLSFVAYSMGAVVARVALNDPRMQAAFKDKLYTFVSVAGPHLGSAGGDSALVGVGQWVLRRWKKIQSLAQLALEDDTLFDLAKQSDILTHFRTIALVSSSADAYVPSFSARVELPNNSTTSSTGRLVEMQRALCRNLMRVKTLSKMELDFEFETQSTKQKMDVLLLGRAAHVHILDSVPLTLTLMLNYGDEWFK